MNDSTESSYVDLCDMVIRRSGQIAVIAAKGRTEEASRLAIALCEGVNAMKHLHLMQQEQNAPNRFDLKGLTISQEPTAE